MRGLAAALGLLAGLPDIAGSAAGQGETIAFTAAQGGAPLQGSFGEFVASVRFDPAHPRGGAVHARVVLASVDAGARAASELLRGAGFFDAAHFPESRFDADDFQPQADGTYLAQGTFTLKGHAVTLPVRFQATRSGEDWWFDGRFTISRLAFGVGQGEWADTATLDDAVAVRFHLRQQPVP